MIKSKFLKEVHIAVKFLQNFNAYRAKLEPLKNWHPDAFSKIPITIRLIGNEIVCLTSFKHILNRYLLSFQSPETMQNNTWNIISKRKSPSFSTQTMKQL